MCATLLSCIMEQGRSVESAEGAYPLITKLSGRNPFPMEEEFPFGSKTDDLVLFQFIEFQKHLVVIVASVHGKGCFAKESFKFVTIRLYNVAVIDVYDRFLRSPFTDGSKIRFKRGGGSAIV